MKLSLFENQYQPIFDKVLAECENFITTNHGRKLVRGVKGDRGNFFEGKVRQDRVPTDSQRVFHNAYNRYFKEKFGIDRLRERCLFCFARDDRNVTVAGYGDTTYLIYPRGEGVKFIYSNGKLRDLFNDVEEAIDSDEYADIVPNEWGDMTLYDIGVYGKEHFEEFYETIEMIMDTYGDFKVADNINGVDLGNNPEIMILIPSQSYFAIKRGSLLAQEMEGIL